MNIFGALVEAHNSGMLPDPQSPEQIRAREEFQAEGMRQFNEMRRTLEKRERDRVMNSFKPDGNPFVVR